LVEKKKLVRKSAESGRLVFLDPNRQDKSEMLGEGGEKKPVPQKKGRKGQSSQWRTALAGTRTIAEKKTPE